MLGAGGALPKTNVQEGCRLLRAEFSSVGDTSFVQRVEVATPKLARAVSLNTPKVRLVLEHTSSPIALMPI